MARTVVVGVVEKDGLILIGKKVPKDGHIMSEEWHIPGGCLKENETPEEGLIREIYEESGLKVKVGDFITEFVNKESVRVLWYKCIPITDEINAGDDLVEAKYVPRKEIRKHCGPNAISLWPQKASAYLDRD